MNGADLRSVLTEAVSSGSTIRVQNVINPLLRLSTVTFPSGIVGAIFLQGSPWLAGASFIVGAIGPLATALAYAYFALRSPERLQSEEFLLAQQRLTLEIKEGPSPDIDHEIIDYNPEHQRLSSERRDEPR